ncbi:MAG: GMC family oxidoreductase [Gammaproteobacteria bacterium]|nr:GMC family oxidoreductase [Gammaproteobacteria bacterium]
MTEYAGGSTSPDILVIGSGFGGSACAARLVECGYRVTLLERGPWRDTVPVRSMGVARRATFPRGRRALLSLVRTLRNSLLPRGGVTLNAKGLFEIHLGRGLHVVCSSSVGGGSHVYAGLNVRPPDPEWWNGIAPRLSTRALEPSYERIFERMSPRTPLVDDQLPNTLAGRFHDKPGLDTRDVDHELAMGLLFPETPGQPRLVTTADGVERWEARPGEEGNLGSEGGGKTTLDFAFLARAMKQGLCVRDLCEVTDVRRDAGGYEVHAIDHHSGRTETLRAPRVVVAAGTLNTVRLLLHSVSSGGLAPMRGLGERFGGNGDFFGYWHLDDATRDLSHSLPVHGLLRLDDMESLGPGRAWPLIAEGALPTPQTLPLGAWISRKLQRGSFVAGMGPDAQNGRVSYRKGRLRIDYDPGQSDIFARIKDAFRLIGERTGKRIYHFATPISVHPTGGACIGPDEARGVVSDSGEAFANPGLYVADAAAFPKPVGGPPSITIAAWGDYVARRIAGLE